MAEFISALGRMAGVIRLAIAIGSKAKTSARGEYFRPFDPKRSQPARSVSEVL